MACSLETYSPPNQNSNHRISFSNDFVEAHDQQLLIAKPVLEAQPTPPSSDFEFSVTNYSMISADEVFFKGKLLPIKDQLRRPTTLRDELLSGGGDGDGDGEFSFGPQRGNHRWVQILGLKRAHSRLKKADNNDGSLEKTPSPVHGDKAQIDLRVS